MTPVLQSALAHKDQLQAVKLNHKQIITFANELTPRELNTITLNMFKHNWDTDIAWKMLLVFNAVNFCYWAEAGQSKWSIEVEGEKLDGSLALLRLIEHTAISQPQILDPEFLAGLEPSYFEQLVAAENPLPIIPERIANLRSFGAAIVAKYHDDPKQIITQANSCARQTLDDLVTNFDCFQDESKYRGEPVYFWKRAQLLIKAYNDYRLIKGEKSLQNMHVLTGFADYKVPQILRHLDLIEYSPELSEQVDSLKLIPKDSNWENEIRIASILVVEEITQTIRKKGKQINPCEVDSILWNRASQNKDAMQPYHRTYTSAY